MGFLDRWFSRKDFDEKLREKISEDVFNGSFSSLNEIDQYLPEYRLAVLNLVKYYIEEEFSDELGDDNDFDNEQECAFLKNTVNDRFPGGINYINYAFSNKYKDEEWLYYRKKEAILHFRNITKLDDDGNVVCLICKKVH
jgi:hypothetical protein